jgi:hypothetical protein
MMGAAITEVVGIGSAHSTICEFCGGMGEDCVPPVEEFGGIAFWRDWIIASTMASRYYEKL